MYNPHFERQMAMDEKTLALRLINQTRQETLQYIRMHPEIRVEVDQMALNAETVRHGLSLCAQMGEITPALRKETEDLITRTLDNERAEVKRYALSILLEFKSAAEKAALLRAIQCIPMPPDTEWI